MADYDNRNTGVLFKNDRKEKPTHPDYKGSFTDENGKEFWVSAWVKDGQKGKFFSMAYTPKEDRPAQTSTIQDAKVVEDDSDELPF